MVQTNFNPEVGFVRRGDMSQYKGEIAWRPLVESSDAIRNLNFSTSVDYYNDSNGRMETRIWVCAIFLVELRLEAFNLFNAFNWGTPNTNFASGAFGRITSMTGDPRILQFGVTYGF